MKKVANKKYFRNYNTPYFTTSGYFLQGKYKGNKLSNVPADYIIWMLKNIQLNTNELYNLKQEGVFTCMSNDMLPEYIKNYLNPKKNEHKNI